MDSKTSQLYNGIRTNAFKTDKDAALEIYGKENSANYRKLKQRLRHRLINSVFLVDLQEYKSSNSNRIFNKVYKNWAAGMILLVKGNRAAAIHSFQVALKPAEKYDLIEVNFLINKELRKHYGIFDYNKTKYEYHKKRCSDLLKRLDILSEAESYYTEFAYTIEMNKSLVYGKELKDTEKRLYVLLSEAKKINSRTCLRFIYTALIYLFIIKKEIESQLRVGKEALAYFEKFPIYKPLAKFQYRFYNGIAQLNLNVIDEALESLNNALGMLKKTGSLGWYSVNNYIFTAYILKKEYDNSYKLISEATYHKAFKTTYLDLKQHWFIKEAFIQFLVKIKKIDPTKLECKRLRAFKLSRFQNDVAAVSKDKKGFNVGIKIITIIFQILDEQFDEIDNSLASLKQYKSRYLKGEEFFRTRTFITMLNKISSNKFNYKSIMSKTEKQLNELKNNPLIFTEQSINIEIIPYEQLWDELMSYFKKRNFRL